MTDRLDREFRLSILGAFICAGIGSLAAMILGAGIWMTASIALVSWFVGLCAVTFVVVGDDD